MKIIVTITGEGRTFDFITTMIAIGSGVGLFSVATLVCDLILRWFQNDKDILKQKYDPVLLDNSFRASYYQYDDKKTRDSLRKSSRSVNNKRLSIESFNNNSPLMSPNEQSERNRLYFGDNNNNKPILKNKTSIPSLISNSVIQSDFDNNNNNNRIENEDKVIIKIYQLSENWLNYLYEIVRELGWLGSINSTINKEIYSFYELKSFEICEIIEDYKKCIYYRLYNKESELYLSYINKTFLWEITSCLYKNNDKMNEVLESLKNGKYKNQNINLNRNEINPIIKHITESKRQLERIIEYICKKYNINSNNIINNNVNINKSISVATISSDSGDSSKNTVECQVSNNMFKKSPRLTIKIENANNITPKNPYEECNNNSESVEMVPLPQPHKHHQRNNNNNNKQQPSNNSNSPLPSQHHSLSPSLTSSLPPLLSLPITQQQQQEKEEKESFENDYIIPETKLKELIKDESNKGDDDDDEMNSSTTTTPSDDNENNNSSIRIMGNTIHRTIAPSPIPKTINYFNNSEEVKKNEIVDTAKPYSLSSTSSSSSSNINENEYNYDI